jgi:CRISPR-associated protein Cas2
MKYVVTYDISNDKRRTKLATLLDKYGIRVNYSVYECEPTKLNLTNFFMR